jgi:membrane protease YdiL (CAAX protease family)
MARSILISGMSAPSWTVRCRESHLRESHLMVSVNLETPPLTSTPAAPSPRVWKFWGTTLWGLFVFVAMFAGQMAVIVYLLVREGGSFDTVTATRIVGGGTTLSLSVITGLPAVVAALWLAIRSTGTSFRDYLALRRPDWKHVLLGALGLAVIVIGWDVLSRSTGRDVQPGFMGDVLKSAQADGALWLLLIAFCVAAPITEELFARGFLYRGWSESLLGPVGAILLSSAAWTALHLQYNWYFFGEIFCIGVWLGFLRWRFQSTWATIVLHGLNNLAAVAQSIYLAG